MTEPLRAVVIGLGQVGWRFDEEPGREAVWTHAGAYSSLEGEIVLAGASDPSAEARSAFAAKYPDVPVHDTVAAAMAAAPDIVSICTPNSAHRSTLEDVLSNGSPRVVWCEKPLATSGADARAMIEDCARSDAILVVSHVRRWSPLWQRFKARMEADLGPVRSLRIAMPNRLWSIGSHAVDLLLWLAGPVESISPLPVPALTEGEEPAVAALTVHGSGTAGIVQVTGLKNGLIVEAEAIGDRGRLLLREDRSEIVFERFTPSARYDGYSELAEPEVERIEPEPGFSPFIEIAREAARLARGEQGMPTCDGLAALSVQDMLEQLSAAAMAGDKEMAAQ